MASDLPPGFELDDHPGNAAPEQGGELPPGFQLDQLPEGFQLDAPAAGIRGEDLSGTNPQGLTLGDVGRGIGKLFNKETYLSPKTQTTETVPGEKIASIPEHQVDDAGQRYFHTPNGGTEYLDPQKHLSKWNEETRSWDVFHPVQQTRPLSTWERFRAGSDAPPEGTLGPITGFFETARQIGAGGVEPGHEIEAVQNLAPIQPGALTSRPNMRMGTPMGPIPKAELERITAGQYDTARTSPVAITPEAAANLAARISSELRQRIPAEDREKLMTRVLKHLPIDGEEPVPFKEIMDLREVINRDVDNDKLRLGAGMVRRALDNYRDNLTATSPDVASGHMAVPETARTFGMATENYALGKIADTLQNPVEAAKLREAAADWGYNADRGIRAKYLRTLESKDQSRGLDAYDADARQKMEDIIKGDVPDAVVRTLARIDPKRSGWGFLPWGLHYVAEAAGGRMGAGMLTTLALAGVLANSVARGRTIGKSNRAADEVRGLSPAGEEYGKRVKPAVPVARNAPPALINPFGTNNNPYVPQQQQE